jgi:hypothetical protein
LFGVLSLGLIIIGPQLFALAFGSAWPEAGRFAQWLALMSLAKLVVNPVAQSLTILYRQDIQLALGCFSLHHPVARIFGRSRAELVIAADHRHPEFRHNRMLCFALHTYPLRAASGFA